MEFDNFNDDDEERVWILEDQNLSRTFKHPFQMDRTYVNIALEEYNKLLRILRSPQSPGPNEALKYERLCQLAIDTCKEYLQGESNSGKRLPKSPNHLLIRLGIVEAGLAAMFGLVKKRREQYHQLALNRREQAILYFGEYTAEVFHDLTRRTTWKSGGLDRMRCTAIHQQCTLRKMTLDKESYAMESFLRPRHPISRSWLSVLRALDKRTRKQIEILAQGRRSERGPRYPKNTSKISATNDQLACTVGYGPKPPVSRQEVGVQTVRRQITGLPMEQDDGDIAKLQNQENNPQSSSINIQRHHPTRVGSQHCPPEKARTKDAAASIGTRSTHILPPSNVVSRATTQRRHQVEVHRLNAEIDAVRARWHQDAEKFDEKDKRRKQIEIDLRAQITHLNIAQQDRQNAGKNPLEKLLVTKDEEVWHLKQKNHEMQNLAGFAQSVPEEAVSLLPDDIPNALQEIEHELQSILHGHDMSVPLLQPSVLEDADLTVLLRTLCSEVSIPGSPTHELLSTALEWSTILLVRSLAVAALQQWVFVTDFPNFCRTGDSQMFSAYRKAILAHDGWDSLGNLELAAYNAIVDDDTFRKGLVPRKAEQLAVRLSKALAPLFSRSSDAHANAIFETWNQSLDVCEDRRFRFVGLFDSALKLKAMTAITYDSYDFVVHPLGAGTTQAAVGGACRDDLRGSPPEGSELESEKWFHASIYVYSGEPALPPDPISDALIQTTNFVTNISSEKRLLCLSKYDLMVEKSLDTAIDIFDGPMTSANSSPSCLGARGETKKRSREEPRQSTKEPLDANTPQKRLKLTHSRPVKEAKIKTVSKDDNEPKKPFRPETRGIAPKRRGVKKYNSAKDYTSSDDSESIKLDDDAGPRQLQSEKRNSCVYPEANETLIPSAPDLKKHRASDHAATGSPGSSKTEIRPSHCPVDCDGCGKTYSNKSNLKIHQNTGEACGRTPREGRKPLSKANAPMNAAKRDSTNMERVLATEGQINDPERQTSAVDDHTPGDSNDVSSIPEEIPIRSLKCPDCNALLTSLAWLNRHITQKVCRQCSDCGKWCRDSHSMAQHLKDEHSSPAAFNIPQKKLNTSSHHKDTEKNRSSSSHGKRVSVSVVIKSPTSQKVDAHGMLPVQTRRLDRFHEIPRVESEEGVSSDGASETRLVQSRKQLHTGSPSSSISYQDFLAGETSLSIQAAPSEKDIDQDRYAYEDAHERVLVSSIPGSQNYSTNFRSGYSLVQEINSPVLTVMSDSCRESSDSDIFLEIPMQQVSRSANPSPSPRSTLSPQVIRPLPQNHTSTEGFDCLIRAIESEALPGLDHQGGLTADGTYHNQDVVWEADEDTIWTIDTESDNGRDSVDTGPSLAAFQDQDARPDLHTPIGFGNNTTSGPVESSRLMGFLGLFKASNLSEEMNY
ncbi:hypothetical protein VTL71DRAFT_115 [Oculimacula yallundae]|uniref:C2H2-type domain-containing protein n=1 Tax=Oculimacula yallundae TaxID=86028 RepID=A0ABR4D0N2_9HELO